MEALKTITLTKPFTLQNGNEITELSLNFEELSVADFRQIRKFEALVSDVEAVSMMDAVNDKELKFEFQLASGFLAAIKGTDGLQASDFLRLPIHDALMLAKRQVFFGFMRIKRAIGHHQAVWSDWSSFYRLSHRYYAIA